MYFANLLLTNDYPMGRMHPPSRKKADWFHSVSIFSDTNFEELKINDSTPVLMMHFFGEKGSPVMLSNYVKLSYHSTRHKKRIYTIDSYLGSYGVVGDIRTNDGYENGFGKVTENGLGNNIWDIINYKWGREKIPYAHNHEEAYNCVGFSDDVLHLMKYGYWNPRIIKAHKKFALYL